MAPDDAGGERRPLPLPLPLPGLRPCVAAGHHPRGGPAGAAVAAGLRWVLEAIVCQHHTVARVAEALSVA